MHNKVLSYSEVKQLIEAKELLPNKRINRFGEEEYSDEWHFQDNENEKYHLIAADGDIIFRLADVARNA
jgi:hypothetical protein